jgi:hypothetical protein
VHPCTIKNCWGKTIPTVQSSPRAGRYFAVWLKLYMSVPWESNPEPGKTDHAPWSPYRILNLELMLSRVNLMLGGGYILPQPGCVPQTPAEGHRRTTSRERRDRAAAVGSDGASGRIIETTSFRWHAACQSVLTPSQKLTQQKSGDHSDRFFSLAHLACAALLAISLLCSAVNFRVLALPPSCPRWTACGSLSFFFGMWLELTRPWTKRSRLSLTLLTA